MLYIILTFHYSFSVDSISDYSSYDTYSVSLELRGDKCVYLDRLLYGSPEGNPKVRHLIDLPSLKSQV
jgi:hypothetical protein